MKKEEFKSYAFVEEIIESYDDEDILNDFKSRFEEGKDISYKDYYNFCMEYIDDMSEVYYIKKNWREEY